MSTKEPTENRLRPTIKTIVLMEKQPLDYEKKLRRRVEDRLRKDREALLLVARVLNIE